MGLSSTKERERKMKSGDLSETTQSHTPALFTVTVWAVAGQIRIPAWLETAEPFYQMLSYPKLWLAVNEMLLSSS